MFDHGAEVQIGGDNFKKWPREGSKVALIDGDLLPYIVGYTVNPRNLDKAKIQVQMGVFSSIEETSYFKDAADHMNWIINKWVLGAGCDAAKIYMTDSASNFRLDLAFSKPYKGQRKSEKPPFFYELREYLLYQHEAILAVGCEADDLISIEMTSDFRKLQIDGVVLGSDEHKAFAGCVCCTQDKDLRMIPGWHYQPKTNHHAEDVFFVDELGWLEPKYKTRETKTKGTVEYIDKLKGAGLKFFYAQCLMGDSADNYPGLPGCGATETFDLIDGCTSEDEMLLVVLRAYSDKWPKGTRAKNHRGGSLHLTAAQMLVEQGRLAYMQRTPGEVWMPDIHLPLGTSGDWNV